MANVNTSTEFNQSVDIQIDSKETEKQLKKIEQLGKEGDKILKTTLNETVKPSSGQNMKDFSADKIQKTYIVKKKVKSRIKIVKASLRKLSASVETQGRPNALPYFKIRAHQKPVRKGSAPAKAQVMKDGSLKPIDKAFVATMKNGHKGVWQRLTKKREPLKQLYGPGASQMLANKKVTSDMEKEMEKRFEKEVEKEAGKVFAKVFK